ncbi:hypothetical protein B1A_03335 [mine drainage metagenome]|uniref:Uncharacterized protein n=1 Tax=mine drainage metagenome TaxID=410659 RepID=T1BUB9_9ZZZZ
MFGTEIMMTTTKVFKPLPEQQKIIDSTEPSIKVKAGAGAGKTTTLASYSEARPKKKIMYLAFNKAIQTEAESRFPKNVVCRTTHSIAYGKEGVKYKQKLAPGIRAIEVSRKFSVNIGHAYAGITTLNAWLHSADKAITQEHAREAGVPNNNILKAMQIAKETWDVMIRTDDLSVPMVHDGYLKLYQLAGHQFNGFDIVLMDEAQDDPTRSPRAS